MYHVIDPTALARRVSYRGQQQVATPLVLLVCDATGIEHRAEYIDDSLLAHGVAHYSIAGREYVLRRNGVLQLVAQAERRAA